MDYARFIKRLELPRGFVAPVALVFDDIVASMLTRAHLHDDIAGINTSLELIQRTRGGWPAEPVTEEGNYVDLVWHECEFRDARSFSYAVYSAAGEYLGCCYFYPLGTRTPLSAELLAHDVDLSWWVTPAAYERGYYEKLFRALQRWSTADFPFRAPHFSNQVVPS